MAILLPRFFALPDSVYPLIEGDRFNILWYSQCDEYTLISYRLVRLDSKFESEILYKNNDVIWDELFLGSAPLYEGNNTDPGVQSSDPRSRISGLLCSLGVPSQVALELRSHSSRVNFQV
jgi:hypothetical protein